MGGLKPPLPLLVRRPWVYTIPCAIFFSSNHPIIFYVKEILQIWKRFLFFSSRTKLTPFGNIQSDIFPPRHTLTSRWLNRGGRGGAISPWGILFLYLGALKSSLTSSQVFSAEVGKQKICPKMWLWKSFQGEREIFLKNFFRGGKHFSYTTLVNVCFQDFTMRLFLIISLW